MPAGKPAVPGVGNHREGSGAPLNFSITDSVEQLEILSAHFLESDAIGVIVEPAGGSSQPRGALALPGNS